MTATENSEARSAAVPGRHTHRATWSGDVTWRQVPDLREALFDALEEVDCDELRLDVRGVAAIDVPGLALLIGANYRATATGRRLVLVDADGPVTEALTSRRMLADFSLTQVRGSRRASGTDRRSSHDGRQVRAVVSGRRAHGQFWADSA